MFELIFSFLAEFVLQAIGQVLLELGLHSVFETFERRPRPWIAAIGYLLLGLLLGGLSLWWFPSSFVPAPWRLVNLVVTPLAVGGTMALMGAWRARRGEALLRIDRFAYGFLFALSVAGLRYAFAD